MVSAPCKFYLRQIIFVNASLKTNPLLWFNRNNFLDNFQDVCHLLDRHHLLLPFAQTQGAEPFDSLQRQRKTSWSAELRHLEQDQQTFKCKPCIVINQ